MGWRIGVASIACVLGAAVPATAWAGPTLALDAQAQAAVANDEMVVTMAAESDGPQVGPLNEAVIAQLDAAIAEAAKVEGVRARLGGVRTHPLHGRDGRPQGWRVRGEVVLESARMQALGQLAGRLAERLQVAGVQFRLSAPKRRQEESRLVAEAAKAFRARAAEAAAAFGYGRYELKSLTLHAAGHAPGPRPMLAARAADAPMPPLPAEGGDTDVVVGVSGTVELRP